MSELSDFVVHLNEIIHDSDRLVEDADARNKILGGMEKVLQTYGGALKKPSRLANLFATGFELGIAYQQAVDLRRELEAAQLPVPSELWRIAAHATDPTPTPKPKTDNKVIQLFKESGSSGPED